MFLPKAVGTKFEFLKLFTASRLKTATTSVVDEALLSSH
jgi:hypothetical protein